MSKIYLVTFTCTDNDANLFITGHVITDNLATALTMVGLGGDLWVRTDYSGDDPKVGCALTLDQQAMPSTAGYTRVQF